MTTLDRTIIIAGAAGMGLVTVGKLLSKVLVRAGYEVFSTQYYMSRIRGGHNSFRIRVSDTPQYASADACDVLFAFDQEAVSQHFEMLTPDGCVVLSDTLNAMNCAHIAVPLEKLAHKPLYYNIAGLGVVCASLDLDIALPKQLLRELFIKKGQNVVDENCSVIADAYEWTQANAGVCQALPKIQKKSDRMLVTGNESLALGAMAAGVKFCSFYPMTPGTSVAETFITHADHMGIVVEQVEDEIAALNMALGASYAGAPALVPTSGGGFALMTEAVSLAGIMEQPIVIVDAQRPGPATGLPTRTEQGDLLFAMFGGHGEFPRIILAPRTIEECFELGHNAIGLAERYQTPVIILTDQFLADSLQSVYPYSFEELHQSPTPELSDEHAADYKRYRLTDSGVSPRRIPGYGKSIVLADSHAHTERGNITEDKQLRRAMVDKMLCKEDTIRADVIPPQYTGNDDPELLLICWGSAEGAVKEAAGLLSDAGHDIAVLSFSQVWPLDPKQFSHHLANAGTRICVEGNSNAQFAWMLKALTCINIEITVSRYDGRPLTAQYILEELEQE